MNMMFDVTIISTMNQDTTVKDDRFCDGKNAKYYSLRNVTLQFCREYSLFCYVNYCEVEYTANVNFY